jgi:peptide/nickel transport system permease protein
MLEGGQVIIEVKRITSISLSKMKNNQFIKRLLKYLLNASIFLISISIIVSSPTLFFELGTDADVEIGFFPLVFIENMLMVISSLFTFYDSTFYFKGSSVPVFPFVFDAFLYSTSVLLIAFVAVIFLSSVLTFFYTGLPRNSKRFFRGLLMVTESIPDVVIFLGLQFVVISIYKSTGLKMFQVYGLTQNVYLLPILSLTVFPLFILIRTLITLIEEENEKDYVLFAYSKGLRQSTVLLRHIVRNVFLTFTNYLGLIYWFMISSLIVVEYLFQMRGFTLILFQFAELEIVALGLLLIILPFLFFKKFFRKVSHFILARQRNVS